LINLDYSNLFTALTKIIRKFGEEDGFFPTFSQNEIIIFQNGFIICSFWQKYSNFEKIWGKKMYFSLNFPMIFVSVITKCLKNRLYASLRAIPIKSGSFCCRKSWKSIFLQLYKYQKNRADSKYWFSLGDSHFLKIKNSSPHFLME